MPNKYNIEKNKNQDNTKANPPLQGKGLVDIFGTRKIIDTLSIKKVITLENNKPVKYIFIPNKERDLKKSTQFNWNAFLDSKIYANLGSKNLESIAIYLINKAKNVICICSFILQNNTNICKHLYEASARGVRIYLLLASETQINKLRENEEGKENAKDHINFLNEAGKGFMFIRTGNFHAKFILIDPKTNNQEGLILTANLTDRALKENNEIGILINGNSVSILFNLFKYGFWSQAEHEYFYDDNSARLKAISKFENNLKPNNEIIWTTNKSLTIKESINKLINEIPGKSNIIISSWIFSVNNEISKQIIKKMSPYSQVLLTKHPKNYESIRLMLDYGINVRCNTLQHAKFIIIGDKALIFSSNFESLGLEQGFEVGICVNKQEDVYPIRAIFNNWFSNAEDIAFHEKSLSEIVNKEIEIISKESEKPYFNLEKKKKIESVVSFDKVIELNFDQFLKLRRSINLDSVLKAELSPYIEFKPKDFYVKTNYNIIIRPKIVPNNVIYSKTINNYHIFKGPSKKNYTNYIVLNEDPFSSEKKLNEIVDLSKAENADIVFY